VTRRRSRQNEVRVGLLLLVAAGVFSWMAIQIGAFRGLGDTVTVTLHLPDAAGLVKDSAVKVAGVGVGGVTDLRVDFDEAVATLVLRADANLRTDVRAEVRARSLLGEKYLALVPRSQDAPLLKDGDAITNVRPSVEIDQLIAALGPVLTEIDPKAVASLVDSLATIAASISGSSDDLTADVRELLAALKEASKLAPALTEDVPPLLKDARQAVRGINRSLGKVDKAVDGFAPLADRATGTLDRIDAAADAVPPAVSEARALMKTVEPGADDLARALESSDEAVARLNKVLANFEGFDEEALRRLLRQEGVLVRLKPEKASHGER
jgi:phospholipid/cholesterol/gamma-HCH transport system substrate-binding protein